MTLEWKDTYKTGEPAIDAQHRDLFVDVAEILKATDRESLLQSLMKLVRHTQTHFEYEEQVMQRIAYPEIGNHFKAHTDLMAKITLFSERVASESISHKEVEEFVVGWLVRHITSSDAKLATYMWSFYPN